MLTLASIHGQRGDEQPVLSHVSAPIMHELPVWQLPLERVHFTRNGPGSGRVEKLRHVHTTRLEPRHIVMRNGIALTSAARTIVDIARSSPFEQAVVVGDAALHRGLVSADDLREQIDLLRNAAGMDQARLAVDFMDGRSESVGESRSRVLFHREGIGPPRLQALLRDSFGTVIGRVDFLFDESVVGEFDGKVKYGALLRPGDDPGDVVFREKIREDAIREAGWIVIRWTWADLEHPERLIARILNALQRAGR